MSTRNLSGEESPRRSSSVRFRTRPISSTVLTRFDSCQRQSFQRSSGTSAQIGARRLTAGLPSGPRARAGSRRLTKGVSSARARDAREWVRGATECAGGTAADCAAADCAAGPRSPALDSTKARLRTVSATRGAAAALRIIPMQTACTGMIHRPEPQGSSEGAGVSSAHQIDLSFPASAQRSAARSSASA